MKDIVFYLKGKENLRVSDIEILEQSEKNILVKRNPIFDYQFKKFDNLWYLYINNLRQSKNPIGDSFDIIEN